MKQKRFRLLAGSVLPMMLLCSCGNGASGTATDEALRPAENAGEVVYEAESAEKAGEEREAALDDEPAAFDEFTAEEADEEGMLPTEVIPESQSEAETEPPADDNAQPFVLTAGEWNDNENWGFFANLIHNGTITFPSYGLDPVHRIALQVKCGEDAVYNQPVTLSDADGEVLWRAKTDRSGNAYLFYPKNAAGQTLTLHTDGAEDIACEVPAEDANAQGGQSAPTLSFTAEVKEKPEQPKKTEVMFILDTTGSMGDEITYLQKDFAAIAGEVSNENMTFSVNFYKDEGDEYITRCNPFTDDVKEIQKLLNQEYAQGGGDEPEAVAQILEETITNGSWSDDTAKIAFLIFDAPPHNGSDTEKKLQLAIASAAERGVHLVPVVASNAARETELFGRAAAIMTNSNYVFLTDDSGVGDSHLEPIIGDYDVELLHDIIVRNIREVAA